MHKLNFGVVCLMLLLVDNIIMILPALLDCRVQSKVTNELTEQEWAKWTALPNSFGTSGCHIRLQMLHRYTWKSMRIAHWPRGIREKESRNPNLNKPNNNYAQDV